MSKAHSHAGEKPFIQRVFNRHGEATRFAKKLAICSASTVTVRRHVNGWVARWPLITGPVKSRPGCLSALLDQNHTADEQVLPNDRQEEINPELPGHDFMNDDDSDITWAEAAEACAFDEVDQVLEDIRGEILDDCEDWARSDEEGWYYGDD